MDTSSTEFSRAILAGVFAAIIGALLLAVVVRVLVEIPFITTSIGIFMTAGGIVGIGYGIGESVKYASGKKLDKRLKYVVAGAVFLAWVATAAFLPLFSVSSGFLGSPIGIVGLIAAFYVATNRVRI